MTQSIRRAAAPAPRHGAAAARGRRTGLRRRATLAGGAAALLMGLSGCAPFLSSWQEVWGTPSVTAPAPVTTETGAEEAPVDVEIPAARSDTTALALLDSLPVKGRAPKTGYDREAGFGTAWQDVDRNGCDTRNDILARDLTDEEVASGGCRVTSGTLTSPYSGKQIRFVRGNDTSPLVQIDHLVSLSNAWQTGAQQLSQEQRVSLANDPINLLAVDQRSNAQKGDGDTATWLPANRGFRCAYVAGQVSVKAAYGLWVTGAERDAMRRVLATCPDERAVVSPLAPLPAPAVEPAPTRPPFETCDAARAAGAAPVRQGDPGYGRHLDRDGDGIGCQ